jgi:hypothetical protein
MRTITPLALATAAAALFSAPGIAADTMNNQYRNPTAAEVRSNTSGGVSASTPGRAMQGADSNRANAASSTGASAGMRRDAQVNTGASGSVGSSTVQGGVTTTIQPHDYRPAIPGYQPADSVRTR